MLVILWYQYPLIFISPILSKTRKTFQFSREQNVAGGGMQSASVLAGYFIKFLKSMAAERGEGGIFPRAPRS